MKPVKLFIFLFLTVLFSPLLLWAQMTTLIVSEDTWIHVGNPANMGTDAQLNICPAALYRVYLKFDLNSLAGQVASAELRMTRTSGSRPEEISVYLIYLRL